MMKQELKALKQERLMYNNRLGELETELRKMKLGKETYRETMPKRSVGQGLLFFKIILAFCFIYMLKT